MLRNVQSNIVGAITCINLNFLNLLFAEALRRIFPEKERTFQRIVDNCLHLHSLFASALQLFVGLDAGIADIPFEEERRMLRLAPPVRNNQSFDQLSPAELRDLTGFNLPALKIIKRFLGLPPNIFIRDTTGELIGEAENHAGCRFFYDEEMILFCLAKLAKGLRTTVLTSGGFFGGDRRRWSLGFRFFLKYVSELVFPQLIGFDGIRRFVPQFPAFAASLEKKVEKPRVTRGRDGVEREVAGRLFCNGTFNIVGFFDCRIQKTNVPGTGPDPDGHRRLEAYEIQAAVYSGHKKVHGMKAFTCMLANGLSFMHHPISARR